MQPFQIGIISSLIMHVIKHAFKVPPHLSWLDSLFRFSTEQYSIVWGYHILSIKNLPANAGDTGSILGLGRSPGKGNGNPLQYFCLENPMDRGAWRATVHRVAKSQTQLSDFTFTFHTGLLKRGSCSPLPTQGCLNEQNGMHWLGSLYLY